jgi:hypothetical protein
MPSYGREFGVHPRVARTIYFDGSSTFLHLLARNRSTYVNMVQYQSPRKSGFSTATEPVFGVPLSNAWLRSLTRTRLVLRAFDPSAAQKTRRSGPRNKNKVRQSQHHGVRAMLSGLQGGSRISPDEKSVALIGVRQGDRRRTSRRSTALNICVLICATDLPFPSLLPFVPIKFSGSYAF